MFLARYRSYISLLFVISTYTNTVQASGLYVPGIESGYESTISQEQMSKDASSSQNAVSVNFGYATADALWTGDGEIAFADREGATNTYGMQFDYTRKVSNKLSLNVALGLKTSKLSDADVGNRTSGESISKISGYGLSAKYSALHVANKNVKYSLAPTLGIRLPGDGSPYDFLALHDGANKLDLGFVQALDMAFVTIQNSFKYSIREGIVDQMRVSLVAPFKLSPNFKIGPNFVYFNTFGGLDIGTPGFAARNSVVGGPAFPEVNEDFFALGTTASYVFDKQFSLNTTFLSKIEGTNTDQSNQFSMGMGYLF